MKKKTRKGPMNNKMPKHGKRGKAAVKRSYPDADPEWEHLEERYSQINSDMKKLASLLVGSGSPDGQEPS